MPSRVMGSLKWETNLSVPYLMYAAVSWTTSVSRLGKGSPLPAEICPLPFCFKLLGFSDTG